ncbi:MAG: hypothetical protein KGH90_05940 [Xanthomonadaceae bacterium]|jgi:hypothetical protein|nr:hypothetical protein [Xanthomonadaceae bacterium]
MHAKIHRLMQSAQDIYQASLYLQEWVLEGPVELRRAIMTAAIVSYCRPFTSNRGAVDARKLAIADYLDDADYDELQLLYLHDRLMLIRDTVVAHSDLDAQPITLGARTKTGFNYEQLRFDVLGPAITIDEFQRLCSLVARRATDEMHRLAREVLR